MRVLKYISGLLKLHNVTSYKIIYKLFLFLPKIFTYATSAYKI